MPPGPRYPGGRDLRKLITVAILENFGYRQLMVVVRARAWWTLLRKQSGWGEMPRAGFATPPVPNETIPSETVPAEEPLLVVV